MVILFSGRSSQETLQSYIRRDVSLFVESAKHVKSQADLC